jgi:hypothetical protein
MEVSSVTAAMAALAADTVKQPARTPRSVAAREVRKTELRTIKGTVDNSDVESASPVIQTTTIALDLMNEGSRQPRSTLQQVLDCYAQNDE